MACHGDENAIRGVLSNATAALRANLGHEFAKLTEMTKVEQPDA